MGSHSNRTLSFYFQYILLLPLKKYTLPAVFIQLGYTTSPLQCILNFDPLAPISGAALDTNFGSPKNTVVRCPFICHCRVCHSVKCLCSLGLVYTFMTHRDVCDEPLLCTGLCVRTARKACWHAYTKIRPDVEGHPGSFGTLHFTYFLMGHT